MAAKDFSDFRRTPDVYAAPALQAGRSRASVVSEIAGYPARALTDAEQAVVRMPADAVLGATATGEGKRALARLMTEHGFAILTVPEGEWGPIEAMFKAWTRFCETCTDEEKWQCAQNDDGVGYMSVPGLMEQWCATYQGGLGTEREYSDRGSWPVKADRTAGIDGKTTLAERDGAGCTAYPWPKGDVGHEFREVVCGYYAHMSRFGRAFVEAALEGLGVDVAHPAVAALFDARPLPDGIWSNADLKAFRYLHVGSPGDDDKETQVGEVHVDIGLMTLIPLASTPGLQALDKTWRVWADLEKTRKPRDLLVFFSDAIRVLTGGYLGGTVHRVMRHSALERISIPFILRPPSDAPIALLPRAGTAFEDPACTNDHDLAEAFPRYDPEFRITSFSHVIPSVRQFAYLLKPAASGGGDDGAAAAPTGATATAAAGGAAATSA